MYRHLVVASGWCALNCMCWSQLKLKLLAVHLSLNSPDAFRWEPDLAVHALKLLLEPHRSRWRPMSLAKPVQCLIWHHPRSPHTQTDAFCSPSPTRIWR